MKEILVEKWKSIMPDGKEVDEDLIIVLKVLINNKKPEELPRGLDYFRTFGRISSAFEIAEKEGKLILEESDYNFIKDTIVKDIPATWGMNKNISLAIEKFLNLPIVL